jgi:hypothetical protein
VHLNLTGVLQKLIFDQSRNKLDYLRKNFRAWAESVYKAWRDHHATIKNIIDIILRA